MPENRAQRRILTGKVVSDRMTKTVTVQVERLVRHPKIGKTMRRSSTCYVHDEKEEAKAGDRVEIMETRPMSRLKRWRLVRIVEASPTEGTEAPPATVPQG